MAGSSWLWIILVVIVCMLPSIGYDMYSVGTGAWGPHIANGVSLVLLLVAIYMGFIDTRGVL